MPTVIPYIPSVITVHLGVPDSDAPNVTVDFADYIKNVVSSEIYPTWEPQAIIANTLAVISYALNRFYTEYYRSRSYPFDITASTAYDQKFINGRNIYENISAIVDDLFTDYLKRIPFVEPLAAKFCNGVSVTCEGLSQWGSQYLAQDGAEAFSILQSYYGDSIEIVEDAPVLEPAESYPGTALREGSLGVNVLTVQVSLNRISQNYPAIPKVTTDAIFGPSTTAAVKAFQSVFSLEADGIVGRATWYRLVFLYVAVERLEELQSEGQTFLGYAWEYPERIEPGEVGAKVTHLQYMLEVISRFVSEVPGLEITGSYTDQTQQAVAAFQQYAGLPVTGTVDLTTWDAIYSQYSAIEGAVFENDVLFPVRRMPQLDSAAAVQQELQAVAAFSPAQPVPAVSGKWDPETRRALAAFQRVNGLKPTGTVTDDTSEKLCQLDRQRAFQDSTGFLQYPGTPLAAGMRDREVPL